MEYNCALLKVGWLAARNTLRVVGAVYHFPPALAYYLHNPPANGKQGPIPEEMSQSLLTIKNPGNLQIKLLSQHKVALTARVTLFAL